MTTRRRSVIIMERASVGRRKNEWFKDRSHAKCKTNPLDGGDSIGNLRNEAKYIRQMLEFGNIDVLHHHRSRGATGSHPAVTIVAKSRSDNYAASPLSRSERGDMDCVVLRRGNESAASSVWICKNKPTGRSAIRSGSLRNEAKYIRQLLEFGKIDGAPPPVAKRDRPSPAIEHAKHVRLGPLPVSGFASSAAGEEEAQKQTHFIEEIRTFCRA